MTRPASPSRQAREAAGLTLRQVARTLHVSERRLAAWERHGWPHYRYARWAMRLYQARGVACDIEVFHGPAERETAGERQGTAS